MHETLPMMLKELRLSAFAQHYQRFQEQAIEKSWNHSQFLAALCEQEIARRYTSRISNWTKEARLPRGKSLATLASMNYPNQSRTS